MNKVAVFGGLGNQMFQYALAIAMDANGNPTKISFNDYFLNKYYQGFELLKAFNVPLPIEDRFKVLAINKIRPLFEDINIPYLKEITSKINFNHSKIYKEKEECVFDINVFNQSSSLLVGTWQSFRYFESQSELIKEIFNFNKPKDIINLKIANEIKYKNSIAVHVRRGDFVKPKLANRKLVIDSNYYYYKSFDLIMESVNNPIFYIFSDDIMWAKENFKGSNFVFVSHNTGRDSYLDMYLMSLCKHFIIANSSFSWWAAWLADNKSKKVIMPKPWIKDANCSGIYPEDWTVLNLNNQSAQLA